MPSAENKELYAALEKEELPDVREKLAHGVYSGRKRRLVEEWVHQKEGQKDDAHKD